MNIGPTRFMPQGGVIKWSIYLETCETAMVAFDGDTGEPLCTLTVCPPMAAQRAGADEVWVKTWAANEGVYEALFNSLVITPSDQFAVCGYELARIGVLTKDALNARDLAWQEHPGLMELRAKIYPKEGTVG